jgi:hypothetical protein
LSTKLVYALAGQADLEFNRETTLMPLAADFEFNEKRVRNRRHDVIRIRTIIEGASEADIKTQTLALVAKLVDGGTLTLYQTDGATPTAHAFSDVRWMRYGYPEPTGPELATRRTLELEAESYTNIDDGEGNLVSFQESLTYSGGGGRFAIQETIEGPAKRHQVAEATAYWCTQRGSAVAKATWYLEFFPRFPSAQMEAPEYEFSSFRSQNGEIRYTTRWAYRFGSPTALAGFPAIWV